MTYCKCKKPKYYTSLDRGQRIMPRCKICGGILTFHNGKPITEQEKKYLEYAKTRRRKNATNRLKCL